MGEKAINFLVCSLLIVPLLGVFVIAGAAKISQVHAQEMAYNSVDSHINHMTQMMDSSDKQKMIDMMKEHHGANWQQECSKMFETMKNSS